METDRHIDRYAKLSNWKPSSYPQVLKYLRSNNYKIPLNRKTKRPTCNDDALERLFRKYPTDSIIPIVRDYRTIQKANGYVSDSFVGKDGRFHSLFTKHPKTGRYSSRGPNLQQLPNPDRAEGSAQMAARKIRSTIVASPGYILLERDFKAEESLLLGYFAGDDNYMRMARLGIYDYFVALQHGIEIDLSKSDDELLPILKQAKKDYRFDRELWKIMILALGYGEEVYSMAKQQECFFIDQAKVAALRAAMLKPWYKNLTIDPFHDSRVIALTSDIAHQMAKTAANDYRELYWEVAPKVKKWQEQTRNIAHKEKKLTNPWGWSLDFFDVKRQDGSHPTESNEVLAFMPQSSGGCLISDIALAIDEQLGNDPDFHMMVLVHDSILAECKIEKADYYDNILTNIMETPIKELGGLVIKTDGKRGFNWAWDKNDD